jgi:hypothetical protein
MTLGSTAGMGVGGRGTGVGGRETRWATGVAPEGARGANGGAFDSSGAGAAGAGATGTGAAEAPAMGVAVADVPGAGDGGIGLREGGLGGFGRCEGGLGGAPTTGGGPGISTTAAGSGVGFAPGGLDGGRGGSGRLRLAAGGTDIGLLRTGGGGGRLRAGSATAGDTGVAEAWGSDSFFAGSGRGIRDGADGGIERPVGRGGAGFFDELSSSAMPFGAYTKPETREPRVGARKARGTRRAPPPAPCMLCGGAR